jgi:uncharacterized protein YjbI with pentapeptide repeats
MSETMAFTVRTTIKPEVVSKRIASFEKRFGKAHLYLAYHAAFPLALTPDLLYRLWANFPLNIHSEVLYIPWVAVADLLLSSLCDEVGYQLYEMDLAVRNELLSRLLQDENFGQERINHLSEFLLNYIRHQLRSDDPDIYDFAQAQRWTALAYTHPSKAASELALFLSKLNQEDKTELLRLGSLVETLALPLGEKFQPLLIYARGMAIFARGNLEGATALLNQVIEPGNRIRIAGVNLPFPEQLKPTVTEINYHHANLRGCSFKGQNLTGADFSHSDIRGANFFGATLIGANFSHTTAGLQLGWATGLIICSLLLSGFSVTNSAAIGYLIGFLLLNNTFIGVVGLLCFAVACFAIIRQGLPAILGAVALALPGVVALFLGFLWTITGIVATASSGVIGVATTLSGLLIVAFGVVAVAGAWAALEDGLWGLQPPLAGYLPVATALILFFTGSYAVSIAGIAAGNIPIPGIAFSALEIAIAVGVAFGVSVVLALGVAVGLALGVAVFVALGVAVFVALGVAVAMAVIAVATVAVVARLGTVVTEAVVATVALLTLLGAYIAWRSLEEDDSYAFIQKAGIALAAKAGTSFQGANLTDANFTQATLKNTNFRQANLTRTCWSHAKKLNLACVGSYLKYPEIMELAIAGIGQGKNFDELPLRGLNLCKANLADASFIGTDLKDANLQDADLSRTKLVQTQLDRTDLTGACLTGACIQGWNITSSTKLDGVECDYIYMRLPTKENPDPYRIPENHQEIFEPSDFPDLFTC